MLPETDRSSQLLVLDPRLPGWATLVAATEPGVAILVLDPAQDGLAQIAEVAAEFAPLTALHIAEHGTPGRLRLGSTVLDAEGVAERADALAALGCSLAPGGALLLWCAEIGASATGARFVASLSRAMARDVRASDDRTAPPRLSGDWQLAQDNEPAAPHPWRALAAAALGAPPPRPARPAFQASTSSSSSLPALS